MKNKLLQNFGKCILGVFVLAAGIDADAYGMTRKRISPRAELLNIMRQINSTGHANDVSNMTQLDLLKKLKADRLKVHPIPAEHIVFDLQSALDETGNVSIGSLWSANFSALPIQDCQRKELEKDYDLLHSFFLAREKGKNHVDPILPVHVYGKSFLPIETPPIVEVFMVQACGYRPRASHILELSQVMWNLLGIQPPSKRMQKKCSQAIKFMMWKLLKFFVFKKDPTQQALVYETIPTTVCECADKDPTQQALVYETIPTTVCECADIEYLLNHH